MKIVYKSIFIILILSVNIYAVIIDVQDYGAEVNDDIDDYYAIQRAIEALDQTKSGKLVFHKGVYDIHQHKIDNNRAVQRTVSRIDKSKTRNTKFKKISKIIYLNEVDKKIKYKSKNIIRNFTFKNYTDLTIEGNGAILNFDGDWTRTADYTLSNSNYIYSRHNAIGIEVINSKNVLIRNIELNGGADKTIKIANTEGFSDGIMIGGSSLVTINNVYVHHYHADGLYLYATKNTGKVIKSEHISILNSRFKNNARQGCSIAWGRNIHFYNCSFSNTGNTGTYGGHYPKAGVDIEPHHDVKDNGNITFHSCNFDNNLGFAYVGSNAITTPYPIKFRYCTFSNRYHNHKYAAVVPSSKKTEFTYCFFNEISMWPNYGTKDKNGHVEVNVYNSKFKSKQIAQIVLLAIGNGNLRWNIKDSLFQLNSSANAGNTKHKFYISNNKKVLFQKNTIEMSQQEYQTYRNKPHVKFILRNTVIYGNRWRLKLPTTPIKRDNVSSSPYGIIYNTNGIIILNKIGSSKL